MKVELLPTFITGHPVIDGEHRKIVDCINAVSEAVSAGEHAKCSSLLDGFLNICADHFAAEERLLADLGYPDLRDHAVFHKELILKAKAVKTLCMDAHSPDSIRRCFNEMATLLIEDVVKGDMQFVSYLIEHGEVDPRNLPLPPERDKPWPSPGGAD